MRQAPAIDKIIIVGPREVLAKSPVAEQVFGFPTSEKQEHISPRLLFMLSYFSDLVAPGRMIAIESAYRSPDYNDKIRKKGANAARTSTHMDGMALDFWLEGVDGKKLWQTIREQDCCGVGHYGGKTIHLDAGRPRFWEAATSGTKTAARPTTNDGRCSTKPSRPRILQSSKNPSIF